MIITTGTVRWLSGVIWLTMGTGLARIAPVFLGLAFARQYEPTTYAFYVAFVIAVNLVASIPLMGTTQLMLSEPNGASVAQLLKQYLRSHLIVHATCWLASIFLGLPFATSAAGVVFNLHTLLILYFYSLGYCFTGVVAAAFSKVGRQSISGRCWAISTIFSSVLGFAGIGLHIPASTVLILLAVGWMVGGLLCLYTGLRQLPVVPSSTAISQGNKSRIWSILTFGAPSVVYLFGFFVLVQQARQSADPALQGAFSLGYQLFSAALFLPGMLGNFVTPRLTRLSLPSHARSRFIWQMLGVYLSIAAAWLCLTYLALPTMLVTFQLPVRADVKQLVMLLQGCAGVASFLALLNQLMVAERLSNHLFRASLIWLVVSILPSMFLGEDAAFTSASAMIIAYMSCLFYTLVVWLVNQRSRNHEDY